MNPTRRRIYHHLAKQIAERKLQANDRLPTEMELAEQFKTSRMNAHHAVSQLAREGLVRRNKKQGTMVNENISWPQAAEVKNLSASRVHIIASLKKAPLYQWNKATLSDLEEVLQEKGLELYHEQLPEDLSRDSLEQLLNVINDTGSSAVVFLSGKGEGEFLKANVDAILEYRGEVYLFERGTGHTDEWPFHSLQLDPFGEGVVAARYLYETGHRRIVFASKVPPHGSHWLQKRLRGLQSELRCISRGKHEVEVWEVSDDFYGEETLERLRQTDDRVTLVAPNDLHARRLLETSIPAGVAAPDHFSLLSFGNVAECLDLQLTTVTPPIHKIGKILGKLITERDKWFENGEKVAIKLPAEVIERKTCVPVGKYT